MKAERDQAGGWSSCSGERRWGLGTELRQQRQRKVNHCRIIWETDLTVL